MKRLSRHRLQRVVRSPLFADRRDRFLADRLAAQRACAVRRVDEAANPAARSSLSRSDEYSSCPDPLPTSLARRAGRAGRRRRQTACRRSARPRGRCRFPQVVNEDGDRLRRVSGRFERLEPHAPELDGIAVAQRMERRTRPSRRRPDRSSRPPDREAPDGRRESRHENGSGTRGRSAARARAANARYPSMSRCGSTTAAVRDSSSPIEIGGVGQAIEVELLQNHGHRLLNSPPPIRLHPVGVDSTRPAGVRDVAFTPQLHQGRHRGRSRGFLRGYLFRSSCRSRPDVTAPGSVERLITLNVNGQSAASTSSSRKRWR